MWTSKNRARYDAASCDIRAINRTDEWGLVEPLIPPARLAGGKRT